MTDPRASRRGDERGSVLLVVILMAVASMLVLVTVGQVSAGLNRVSDDQTRSNAFQYANAGIDQALRRIETKPLSLAPITASGFTYAPVTTLDGAVTRFTETFAKGGITYAIEAEQAPQGQDTVWRVNSTGTDASGKLRQAVANIRATSLFENGLFTTNTFYLTGNQFNATSPVAYDSSLCPAAAPAASPGCDLPKPVAARLGSNVGFPINSPASLRAMVDQWAGFAVYGQATVEDARELCGNNTKCHSITSTDGTRTGNVVAVAERLSIEMPQPAITGSCPNGGRLGSGVKPPMSVLPVGDYRCSRLIIQGTLTVSGDAKRDVRMHVDNELSIVPAKTSATVVNAQTRPSRFQLYLPDREGSANVSQICGSEIWALLYTPGLSIDCHGSAQTRIYGAVVARSYSGTGNHFSFHWDAKAATAVNNGKYRVYNWRECPVGTVDC
jgi:hypothetical protein